MLTWLSSNATSLSIIGAVIASTWPVIQFVITRQRDLQFRDFEAYHRLIKELVSPPDGGQLRIDRQAAVVFELRHFPRYYEFSDRTLRGLRDVWSADPEKQFLRLIEEIDLTLRYLSKKLPRRS
jgi:hypothetical protein